MTSETIDNSQKRKPRPAVAGIAWFLLLAVLIVAEVIRPFGPAGMDFFAHAAIGRWIAGAHQIPRHSLFLWSGGMPWIDHSWLSDLMLYGFMSIGDDTTGEMITLIWTAVMSVAIFAIPYFWLRPREPRPIIYIAAVTIGIFVAALRLVPRPEMFSDLATMLVLLRLLSWRDIPEPTWPRLVGRIAPITCLFALWANLHGGVLYGIVLIIIAIVADSIQYGAGVRTRALAVMLVCSTLAIAINPYGFHYFSIFSHIQSLTFASITEWRPVFALPPADIEHITEALCLVALAAAAWTRSTERRWALLGWLGFATIAFIMERRNIIGLDWVCLAVLSRCREGLALPEARTGIFTPTRLQAALLIVVIGWGLASSNITQLSWPLNFEPSSSVPCNVAAFMTVHNLSGRVFGSYASSPYLEWKLYGHNTFFIDTMNAYPDDMLKMYVHLLFGDAIGRDYEVSNGVNIVQADAADVPQYRIYRILSQVPNWALVYKGEDGYIWIRKLPQWEPTWSNSNYSLN